MTRNELLQVMVGLQAGITALVAGVSRDPELAEEVFSRMIDQIQSGKLRSSDVSIDQSRRYLFKVALNLMNAEYRQRTQAPRSLDIDVRDRVTEEVTLALERTEEMTHALEHCLEKISPRQRQSLWDRYVKGMTVKEIKANGDPRREDSIYKEMDALKRRLRSCVEQELRRS